MKIEKWLLCPVCHSKTRLKLREDTILINFPLYCPKCKQETLINVCYLLGPVASWYNAHRGGRKPEKDEAYHRSG